MAKHMISATTYPGCEAVVVREMEELLGEALVKTEVETGVVSATVSSSAAVIRYAHHAQGVLRLFLCCARFSYVDADDLIKKVASAFAAHPPESYLVPDTTFSYRMRCKVDDTDDVVRDYLEQELSAKLIPLLEGFTCSVDLKRPDLVFFCQVMGNRCYLGIDLFPDDIGKREWKLFAHRASIAGVLAYALVRTAGFSGAGVLLDPFCGCGTIPLEAIFFAHRLPVHGRKAERAAFRFLSAFAHAEPETAPRPAPDGCVIYGSDHDISCVTSSAKNAKVGAVNKLLSFFRMNAAYLPSKFEDGAVGCIVSDPIQFSKSQDPRRIERTFTTFFEAAHLILVAGGTMVLLMHDTHIISLAEKAGFALEADREIRYGRHFTEERHVIILKKR